MTGPRHLVLLAMAALALVACRSSAAATASRLPIEAPRSQAAPDSPPSAAAFARRSFSFNDASRDRTLAAEVYYPAQESAGPFPVVLFSHGLRGVPGDYEQLFARWTGSGFAVVAPVYPMTSRGAQDIKPGDLINQPADAIFVLNQVADQMSALLSTGRVVAAGHSEGAVTTVGLFSGCCRDARLAGGLILSGDAVGFERYGYGGEPVPLLFFHGDADPIIPIGLGRATFARAPWPKGFVTLAGAGHIPPFLGGDNPAATVVNSTSIDFLRWVLDGRQDRLALLREDANVPGIARLDDSFSPVL